MTAIQTKPRSPEKVNMFIEIAKLRIKEGRRVNEVLHEGKLIRIISIEDLIVDRLNACKHWKSQYDC